MTTSKTSVQTEHRPTEAGTDTTNMSISTNIHEQVQQIIDEINLVVKGRASVVHSAVVAAVGQLHHLQLGPGGTGKSLLVRDLVKHVDGATYFETALDETSDPGFVFGPPDVKGMVEDGRTRRVTTGYLPEADFAFVDEIMNANSPVLHSLQPIMNERVFHNGDLTVEVPLRCMYAGTNKLNSDADLAPFFDRIHIREVVDYVQGRTLQGEMVAEAVARMALAGRGTVTSLSTKTTIKLSDLDTAHAEALALDIDDSVMNLFLDIREELSANGIIVSDRRMVEGMVGVLANAWVRGHSQVAPTDLDILASMWWTLQDQIPVARQTILSACNPGEKMALDLLDDFDKLKQEYAHGTGPDIDEARKRNAGIQAIKNAKKLIAEAQQHREAALAAGGVAGRLDEVIKKADDFLVEVGRAQFGLGPDQIQRMA